MEHQDSRESLYGTYVSSHLRRDARRERSSAAPVLSHMPANRNARILDIGCGSGELIEQLLREGYRNVIGIDVSVEQVALAHSLGRSQVRLGNVLELDDMSEASFEVVVAVDLLEHLEHDEVLAVLNWIAKALSTEGQFIVQVPNATSPFFGNYAFGDFTHRSVFNDRSIRQVLRHVGFTRVSTHPVNPRPGGLRRTVRAATWQLLAATIKAYLSTETGQLRGHIVTQNLIACAQWVEPSNEVS